MRDRRTVVHVDGTVPMIVVIDQGFEACCTALMRRFESILEAYTAWLFELRPFRAVVAWVESSSLAPHRSAASTSLTLCVAELIMASTRARMLPTLTKHGESEDPRS